MPFQQALPLWGLGLLAPCIRPEKSARASGTRVWTPHSAIAALGQRLGGEDDLGRQAYGDLNELVIVMLPRA